MERVRVEFAKTIQIKTLWVSRKHCLRLLAFYFCSSSYSSWITNQQNKRKNSKGSKGDLFTDKKCLVELRCEPMTLCTIQAWYRFYNITISSLSYWIDISCRLNNSYFVNRYVFWRIKIIVITVTALLVIYILSFLCTDWEWLSHKRTNCSSYEKRNYFHSSSSSMTILKLSTNKESSTLVSFT